MLACVPNYIFAWEHVYARACVCARVFVCILCVPVLVQFLCIFVRVYL